jgi:hypothetical protein
MTTESIIDQIAPPDVKPPTGAKPKERATPLDRKLQDFFLSIGMAVSAFDDVCGPAVVERAPELADSWAKVAKETPWLRSALETSGKLGAWAEALAITGAIGWIVTKHHYGGRRKDEPIISDTPDGEESIASTFHRLRREHSETVEPSPLPHEFVASDISGRCIVCGHPSPSPVHSID